MLILFFAYYFLGLYIFQTSVVLIKKNRIQVNNLSQLDVDVGKGEVAAGELECLDLVEDWYRTQFGQLKRMKNRFSLIGYFHSHFHGFLNFYQNSQDKSQNEAMHLLIFFP